MSRGRSPAPPIEGDEAARIRERYESGEPINRIAADLRTNTYRVRNAIETAGGSVRPPDSWASRRRKIDHATSQEIAERFLRGETKRDLADAYGVSVATITHHLSRSLPGETS